MFCSYCCLPSFGAPIEESIYCFQALKGTFNCSKDDEYVKTGVQGNGEPREWLANYEWFMFMSHMVTLKEKLYGFPLVMHGEAKGVV